MKIRGWIALAAMLLLPMGLRAQTAAPDPTFPADSVAPDPVRNFVYELADPLALANALALGLYDHARTEPYEWGGGLDALTQRIASRAGGHVIGTSVRHGLAAVLERSTEFEPCRGCVSAEDRINHAILETFTDRDATGERVLSEPFLAGTYAGAIAPTLWHPDSNLVDGLKSGTFSILFTVAGRVLFALLEPLAPEGTTGP
jgi:predicted secreted protein